MIRWTKAQQTKLRKTVKRWNDKLTREAKKNPELFEVEGLERKYVKELKNSITSAKELERLVKEVDRAFKPGAWEIRTNSYGVKITQHQLQTYKSLERIVNRKRAEERSKFPEHPEWYGTQETIADEKIPDYNLSFDTAKGKFWGRKIKSLRTISQENYFDKKAEDFKRRYLKSLKTALGGYASELAEVIGQMDANFIYSHLFDDYNLGIRPVYQSEVPPFERAEAILDDWLKFAEVRQQFNIDEYKKDEEEEEEPLWTELDEKEQWLL